MPTNLTQLPNYQIFCEQIEALDLSLSSSELHGVMCGYLCAGALYEGDVYLRALSTKKRGELARVGAQALFNLYSISQQQIDQDNFSFQLFLPEDEQPLVIRAQAFSEWCAGFTQAMGVAGITGENLEEDESQDALLHLGEFAELDYQSLNVGEDDEKAFMEVSEYARMAVLRLYWDIKVHDTERRGDSGPITH